MPKIDGANGIIVKLHLLAARGLALQRRKLSVGYSSPYALFVHENREMKLRGQPRPSGIGVYWGPNGRAGFLTDVAMEMRSILRATLVSLMRRNVPIERCLQVIGGMLMRKSQANVPVEYGDLKASAFVRVY